MYRSIRVVSQSSLSRHSQEQKLAATRSLHTPEPPKAHISNPNQAPRIAMAAPNLSIMKSNHTACMQKEEARKKTRLSRRDHAGATKRKQKKAHEHERELEKQSSVSGRTEQVPSQVCLPAGVDGTAESATCTNNQAIPARLSSSAI